MKERIVEVRPFNGSGLIEEIPRIGDHFLGAEAEQGTEVWEKFFQDTSVRSWAEYNPEPELQRKSFETNSCVSFSANNVAETLLNFEMQRNEVIKNELIALNLVKNGKVNFSDRRTAKGSGTDPNAGNSVRAVDDYIRKFLFCPEDLWPFPYGMSREEYFKMMPAEVADFGKKITSFAIETKYLPTAPWNLYNLCSSADQVWEGYSMGPVWFSVDGNYEINSDGLISSERLKAQVKQGIRGYSHRIEGYGGIYGKMHTTFDHYDQTIRNFAWDYPFGSCKIMRITKKNCTSPFIKIGSAISYLGKGGKYAGQYIDFADGDIFKSINGDYSNAVPKTVLTERPSNHSGKMLTIV